MAEKNGAKRGHVQNKGSDFTVARQCWNWHQLHLVAPFIVLV